MKTGMLEFTTHLEKPSPLYLGYDMDDYLMEKILEQSPDKVFFVTDTTLYNIHGQKLYNKIKENLESHLILVGTGEFSKTIFTLHSICEKMFERKVSKDSLLIAFGGGIVGNITGLAAALIYRGIPFIEVPTTFLAQTDSVLSNKQAVNTCYGKNMLGVYYEPKFILADTKYLNTEPKRYFNSGLVETIKNGLISDYSLIPWMKETLDNKDIQQNPELVFDITRRSIESKLRILQRDPSEKKYCMILEYGHTFGHAIESLFHGTLTHGEAISIGMIIAAHMSNKLGYLTTEDVYTHYELLEKINMPVRIPDGVLKEDLFKIVENDNKRVCSGTVFVILEKLGIPYKNENNYLIKIDMETQIDALNVVQEPVALNLL